MLHAAAAVDRQIKSRQLPNSTVALAPFNIPRKALTITSGAFPFGITTPTPLNIHTHSYTTGGSTEFQYDKKREEKATASRSRAAVKLPLLLHYNKTFALVKPLFALVQKRANE